MQIRKKYDNNNKIIWSTVTTYKAEFVRFLSNVTIKKSLSLLHKTDSCPSHQ